FAPATAIATAPYQLMSWCWRSASPWAAARRAAVPRSTAIAVIPSRSTNWWLPSPTPSRAVGNATAASDFTQPPFPRRRRRARPPLGTRRRAAFPSERLHHAVDKFGGRPESVKSPVSSVVAEEGERHDRDHPTAGPARVAWRGK